MNRNGDRKRATSAPGRLPNLFLIGAAKAGTTWLHDELARHPDVYMSPVKEPHFFSSVPRDSTSIWRHAVVKDPFAYRELFRDGAKVPVVGESSTSYLWDPHSASRIHAAVPDARIVAVLREPVARCFSHYLMLVREGAERRTFTSMIKDELGEPGLGASGPSYPEFVVDLGFYGRQLRRYSECFRSDQVKILIFERLFSDDLEELRSLYAFLGLQPLADLDLSTSSRRNAFAAPASRAARTVLGSKMIRSAARLAIPTAIRSRVRNRFLLRSGPKPTSDPEAEALLREAYSEDRTELHRILGGQTPWPRPSS